MEPTSGLFFIVFILFGFVSVWLHFIYLRKEIKIMIEQHWDLLDYTTSNGITFKDIEAFYEAKKNKKGGK